MQGAEHHDEKWKVDNEVTSANKSTEGQVASACPEKRVFTRFTHSQEDIGASSNIGGSGEKMPNVFSDLNIHDETFTEEEYEKTKTTLKRRHCNQNIQHGLSE